MDRTNWSALAAELDEHGSAPTAELLTPAECRDLAALYEKPELFRTTVDMARHRFGSGEYRYFTHDLPAPVAALRAALYPRLLPIARDWAARLDRPSPGRTTWTNGSPSATQPARTVRHRSSSATARATGTPCTAMSSASWSSRSRS